MKDCFGMKSKQHKYKQVTSVKQPRFKRLESHRSSAKYVGKTKINLNEDIINITTSSTFYGSDVKPPPIWKRIFKRKTLPGKLIFIQRLTGLL